MKRILLLLLVALTLSTFTGCASVKPVEVRTICEQKLPLNMQDPDEIKLYDTDFNLVEVDGTLYYGLTQSNFNNLSKNIAEIKKYMISQKEIINSYRQYYEGSENGNKNERNQKESK